MIPFISEISKLQERVLLPFFVKLSRLQEQFLMSIGAEPTADLEREFFAVYERCRDYTLTPMQAMYAMFESACYVTRSGIRGDFVECGVWKGGSSMVAALTSLQSKSTERKLYVYDTFAGMPNMGVRDADLGRGPFQFAMTSPPSFVVATRGLLRFHRRGQSQHGGDRLSGSPIGVRERTGREHNTR